MGVKAVELCHRFRIGVVRSKVYLGYVIFEVGIEYFEGESIQNIEIFNDHVNCILCGERRGYIHSLRYEFLNVRVPIHMYSYQVFRI